MDRLVLEPLFIPSVQSNEGALQSASSSLFVDTRSRPKRAVSYLPRRHTRSCTIRTY
ncbi:hypothetical protein BDFB_011870 [Asbolus verrucosus]|uniref:Uncharacterized protein n=1 Tax=Asbolus verrucosus TaxID=1661398 RepID=A0A482VK89_ASBVE|nr:hypothetical protein BDFB_011870 [Asbolus verrucosus]